MTLTFERPTPRGIHHSECGQAAIIELPEGTFQTHVSPEGGGSHQCSEPFADFGEAVEFAAAMLTGGAL